MTDTPKDDDPKAATAPATEESDFLAADRIRSILLGREAEEQERIMRWVGESLGLSLHVRHKAPAATAPIPQDVNLGDDSEDQPPEAPVPSPARDIRSFVQEKQPSSDIQFAATVAYYHRFVAPNRKDVIMGEDLQEGARHANRAVFKTPSITLNNAVGQGYLDRGSRGEYKLNAVGENLIAMTLPASGAASKAPRAKRPKRAPTKKTANVSTKRSSKR